jgi:elongation factor Ts
MAEISAKVVMELRNLTGLPMMECKQALGECDGDFEAAKEWLRKKHKGKMEERAGRETGEGRISVFISEPSQAGQAAGMVDLRCETVPVASNELFVKLAGEMAKKVANGKMMTPEPDSIRNDPQIDELFTDTYGKLRETMKLEACRRMTGTHIASYVHHDGKTGVLLALDAVPTDDTAAANLCMHVAFAKPLAVDRSGVADEEVEKVRTMAREVAAGEGKPEEVVEKIVAGKVNSFYAEKVLMEQLHARSDVYGKKTVGEVLKEAGVNAVTDMAIMQIGG